ncbi:DUF5672 family protein [Flammeovirga sp. SubArs3]|uniref:DUF5672 family protein n=1 Tax=Flammeovirga sp. SubArs3 TaxID=2995316 RepID=UPI00248B9F8B|nr:DUF5672 family protein [Flammeovirga sp. SubArs3]
MNNCVITIPIYKSSPNTYEKISFTQGVKVLSKWPIAIVTYEGLDISFYTEILEENKNDYTIHYFDQHYFNSVHTYNELMVNIDFYKTFQQYSHLLIYQTDCFIFKDDIQYWIDQSYSYIGAPWVVNNGTSQHFQYVGNGGFSLRNINDHIKVLQKSNNVLKSLFSTNPPLRLKTFFAYFRTSRKSTLYQDSYKNEDMFFGKNCSKTFKFFTIPTPVIASTFGIEYHADYCLSENNNHYPMGIHAWEKPENLIFWRKHIEKFGYQID